jgi:hypothetical protein
MGYHTTDKNRVSREQIPCCFGARDSLSAAFPFFSLFGKSNQGPPVFGLTARAVRFRPRKAGLDVRLLRRNERCFYGDRC